MLGCTTRPSGFALEPATQPVTQPAHTGGVSRRADPAPIDEARQAATRNRLIGTGLDEATANAWIAAWGAQAAQDGLPRDGAYWEAGWRWIATKRASTRGAGGERG